MGNVIYIKSRRQQRSEAGRNVKRALAERMILTAAEMLSKMTEREKRIGWLLEDCADLLRRAALEQEAAQPVITGFDPEKDLLN